MTSTISNCISAISAKAAAALKPLTLITVFLACTLTAFAAAPSNKSLSGTYIFQFSMVYQANWSNSKTCTYPGVTHTFTAGGEDVNTEVVYGTITFNGEGRITVNYTDAHGFNVNASDDTVSITCPAKSTGSPGINNGHMVVNGPEAGSGTGTYSVSSNGTGSFSNSNGPILFDLGGINSEGIAQTLILRSPESDNNQGTGVAFHQ